MNRTGERNSVGFGLQRDITDDGAVILLRITSPRRLNTKLLGQVLLRYLQGGYATLILDQGGQVKKMGLLEFLGQLQATYTESQLFLLERRLISDRVRY
jgi:hypothetical protein